MKKEKINSCNIKKTFGKWFKKIYILLYLMTLWEILSLIIGDDLILSSPIITLKATYSMIGTSGFWLTLSNSLVHIFAGFLLALAASSVLAVLAIRWSVFQSLIRPIISILGSIPVASFMVISLLWIGSDHISSFVAFIVSTPLIFRNLRGGLSDYPMALEELAMIYELKFMKKLAYIYFPNSISALRSSLGNALGMSIRAGIAAELIANSNYTIGGELMAAKLYLDVSSVFSWTLVIVAMAYILEFLCDKFIGKLASLY